MLLPQFKQMLKNASTKDKTVNWRQSIEFIQCTNNDQENMTGSTH